MLLEHIRLLRERGHWVGAVLRSDSAQRALPPWTSVEADADVVCGLTQRMDGVGCWVEWTCRFNVELVRGGVVGVKCRVEDASRSAGWAGPAHG